MKIVLPLFLLAASLFPTALVHAAPTNLVWVGGYDTGGDAQSVHIVGTNAYVADGDGGLQVISVSNPRQPVWLGRYDTPGEAFGVHVVGETAYVADGPNGLEILDVSDHAHIRRLGGYNPSGSIAYTVHVRANLAYLAAGNLKILDVRNPVSPVLLCNVDIIGAAVDFRTISNYVCFAAGSSLSIYDVSNPSQPVWVTNYSIGSGAFCIDVAGQQAYIADRGTGLHIVDLSDPVRPVRIGQHTVAGESLHVAAAGGCAYVTHSFGLSYALSTFDVSDPMHPVLVMTNNLAVPWADCVEALGDYVLLGGGPNGLMILQTQPPQRPKLSICSVGPEALITWPASALGSTLQSNAGLNASNWTPVLIPPQVDAEVFSVTRPLQGQEFFRLRRQ